MKVQQPAPAFSTLALLPNGTFDTVSLDQYKGKYVVLFFYPLDFTFVCPTEIIAFSDRISDFEKLGTSVIACSVDSVHSHLAWTNVARNKGGLGPMKIPILSDLTKSIAKDYGVLLESGQDAGVALRGTFVIDPKGTLRIAHVHDLPVGRSVDEILRVIEALQFNEAHGDVCPANWRKGDPTMKPDPIKSKDYFSKRELTLTDLDLGNYAPKVMGARIIRGVSPDFAIHMEFDIVYQGGASIAIEAVISGGIKLPTRIYLNGFAGQLRFRLPSFEAADKVGVAFVKDPGVTFSIDAPLSAKTSDTVRGMVNRLLESIVRKVFLDLWVLPAWIKFYLPMMNPSSAGVNTKEKVTPVPSFSSSLALKAANLWEGRAPILAFKAFSDIDPFDNIFSTQENAFNSSKETMKIMQDELVRKFMEISNISHTQNSEDRSFWKSYKKKDGVDYYKRIASNNEKIVEMSKARISIQCDFAKVFSILSNSEHFRYVTDFFESAASLSDYDSNFFVEKFLFKKARTTTIRTFLFEVKKEISDVSFLVAFRSVAWMKPKSISRSASTTDLADTMDHVRSKTSLSLQESADGELRNRRMATPLNVNSEAGSSDKSDITDSKVYLFGYLIEMDPESPASLTNVTLLTCASPAIYLHLGSFKFCTKLKSFIEELVLLSSSLPVQDNNFEARKFDAQGNRIDKLKSYFGNTASYLMKNYNLIKSRENNRSESDISDDESFSTSKMNLNQDVENRDTPVAFDDENYVDIQISSREILKVPVEYVPKMGHSGVKFNWEFMSLTELPIYFGIEFYPLDDSKVSEEYLYERTDSGAWIIFPFSSVSAFARPAFGKIIIQDFPAGKFLLTFDNLATSKRAVRKLTTRCWISCSSSILYDIETHDIYRKPISECHFEITIPRKTILAVPIPVNLLSLNTEETKSVQLNWNADTGGSDIYFSIFYQEKKSPHNIETMSAGEDYTNGMSSIASIESNTSIKKGGETSQLKISKFLGKAKEVYKEVKTVINQQKSSVSPDSSFKSSFSSRINAVVAKSEIASRTIMKAMAGDSTQSQDSLFLESTSFIKNHQNALMIFPHSKINSMEQPFQGVLEISNKPGCYFFLFENSQVLASPKQITCAISLV